MWGIMICKDSYWDEAHSGWDIDTDGKPSTAMPFGP